jgi:hypothetical protein
MWGRPVRFCERLQFRLESEDQYPVGSSPVAIVQPSEPPPCRLPPVRSLVVQEFSRLSLRRSCAKIQNHQRREFVSSFWERCLFESKNRKRVAPFREQGHSRPRNPDTFLRVSVPPKSAMFLDCRESQWREWYVAKLGRVNAADSGGDGQGDNNFAYSGLACFRIGISEASNRGLSNNNFSKAAMLIRKKRVRSFRLEEGRHSR